MSDLSHVSFIAGLLTDDNADARQFWDKKLVSLCGSGVFADTAFVSDLLEFSKSLTANKSIHPSTAAIRHSRAFQAFIKLRILGPLMPAGRVTLESFGVLADTFMHGSMALMEEAAQHWQKKGALQVQEEARKLEAEL